MEAELANVESCVGCLGVVVYDLTRFDSSAGWLSVLLLLSSLVMI